MNISMVSDGDTTAIWCGIKAVHPRIVRNLRRQDALNLLRNRMVLVLDWPGLRCHRDIDYGRWDWLFGPSTDRRSENAPFPVRSSAPEEHTIRDRCQISGHRIDRYSTLTQFERSGFQTHRNCTYR